MDDIRKYNLVKSKDQLTKGEVIYVFHADLNESLLPLTDQYGFVKARVFKLYLYEKEQSFVAVTLGINHYVDLGSDFCFREQDYSDYVVSQRINSKTW